MTARPIRKIQRKDLPPFPTEWKYPVPLDQEIQSLLTTEVVPKKTSSETIKMAAEVADSLLQVYLPWDKQQLYKVGKKMRRFVKGK